MFTRTRRFLSTMLAAALVPAALAVSSVPAQAATLLDDDFESAPLGQPPPGWSVTATGGSVETTTVADTGNPNNHAMCVQRTAFDTTIVASHDFAPTSGVVTIETRLRAAQTDALFYGPVLRDSLGNNIIQLGFHHENGQFSGLISNVWTGFVSYQANTWYNLRVVADTDSDTYDLYWNDDSLVRDDEPFNTAAGDLASIRFRPYDWRLGTACYDNVLVSDGGAPPPPAGCEPTGGFEACQVGSSAVTVDGSLAESEWLQGGTEFAVLSDPSSFGHNRQHRRVLSIVGRPVSLRRGTGQRRKPGKRQ